MFQFPVEFVVLGFLGGCANVLLWAQSYADLKAFKSARQIAIGAIVGFVYSFLHTNYGFPDFVMSFVAGYMGTDFLQGLIERFKK